MADLREEIIRAVLMQSQVPTAIAQSPMGRKANITVNPSPVSVGNTPDMNAPQLDQMTRNLMASYPQIPSQYSQFLQPQGMSVRGINEEGQMQTVPGPQMSATFADQQAEEQATQQKTKERRKNMFWEFLKAAGIPITAGIIGSVAPGTLPAMSGLAGGYAEGYGKGQDRDIERSKIDYQKQQDTDKLARDEKKLEQDRAEHAYSLAKELRKTGPMGALEKTEPDDLREVADRLHQLIYGSPLPQGVGTESITEKVKEGTSLSDKNNSYGVPDNVWNKATDAQRQEFINAYGR